MGYSLQKLAPGSYDLLLDGTIIGSVVQCGAGHGYIRWIAELLEDLPKPQRPFPFQEVEHEFLTLGELCAWLGIPVPAGKIPAAAL